MMGITPVAMESKRTAKKKKSKENDTTKEKGYIRD